METLFENVYISDKKMMREFFRKYSVGPRPVISIITGLFTGLSAQFLVNRGNLWKTISK